MVSLFVIIVIIRVTSPDTALRKLPSLHQWKSTLVSQSSQKKTRAMVAQLDKDGEKAFTCVEVEGTRSKRNSKKSGTEGSTNSDRQYTVLFAVPRVTIARPT